MDNGRGDIIGDGVGKHGAKKRGNDCYITKTRKLNVPTPIGPLCAKTWYHIILLSIIKQSNSFYYVIIVVLLTFYDPFGSRQLLTVVRHYRIVGGGCGCGSGGILFFRHDDDAVLLLFGSLRHPVSVVVSLAPVCSFTCTCGVCMECDLCQCVRVSRPRVTVTPCVPLNA